MTYIHTQISGLKEGDSIRSGYIIDSIRPNTTRQGSPYFFAELKDASGKICAVCWQPDGTISPEQNGEIVMISGVVGSYNGQLQICIKSVDILNRNDISEEMISALVPTAPIDVEAYKQDIISFVRSIQDKDIREICIFEFMRNWDQFIVIPAGKSCHHAFRHGLLMHTIDMARMADCIYTLAPNGINRDLLIAGVLLHDMGKIKEFVISPITDLVTAYCDEGNMIGHPVLGANEIDVAASTVDARPEIVNLLKHIVLSHHGDPNCGSVKEPVIIEAELVHALDMLDSRREIYLETLAVTPICSWSPKVYALNRSIYRHSFA